MARRRRAFSSCYCFSASFSLVVVSFQERTSCPFLNFAQSRRRRFTESFFGVSLRVSDAELSRTRSLPPTAFVRSPFEPSDLASNRESLELVAGVPRASQIWISDPTSVILMPLIVRDPSMLNRRSVSPPSGFSDSDRSAPHDMQSSAVSTAWTTSHQALHSHAARTSGFHVSSVRRRHGCQVPELGQTMWKELLSYWAWPINDFINFSLMGSFGSWPSWRFCLASHSSLIVSLQGALPTVWSLAPTTPGLPCDLLQDVRSGFVRAKQQTGLPPTGSQLLSRTIALDVVCCRNGETEIIVHLVFNCPFARKVWSLAPTTPDLPCDLLQDVRSGFVRAKQQTGALPTVWRLASTTPGLPCDLLQDVRLGFVRAKQQTGAFTILLLEGENCSTTILVFMALVCACVAQSGLELEGRSSETLLSDIFKGSASWCFVTPAKVADVLIVISVLVTVSIAKSRSLLVLFASQGLVSLTSSKIVKVRRLHDIYGLSVKIVCIYPFTFYACVFRLLLEAAMVVLAYVVNNSSFNGEY